MSTLPTNADYTDKDFDALRARLFALVGSAFPAWSDTDTAGFGTLLIEMFAFVGDVLTAYQDNHAREGKVVTATRRRSLIQLARHVGYELPGSSAATVDVTFSLSASPQADVTFPAGTEVRTPEITSPVRFRLLADLVIAAAADPATGVGSVEHSEQHSQTYDAAGLRDLAILLDRSPFLDGSADITAGNGAYEEQDNLLESSATDRHFEVLVDEHDRATIRFGDGTTGAPPTGTVAVTYSTGGGAAGNVDAAAINTIEGSFLDAEGRSIRVAVANAEAASGGVARQTVEAARLAIPESIRATSRSVTREDFEIHAREVAGVARALMVTSNEDAAVDENAGIVYPVPDGGGTPSAALLAAVLTMVTETKPCTLTFSVQALAPTYLDVDVWARVYLDADATGATVRAAIVAALTEWFQISNTDGTPNENVDFGHNLVGDEVAWSDVFDLVRDTVGVRKVPPTGLKLNDAPASLAVPTHSFPVLGDVTIIDASTGEAL